VSVRSYGLQRTGSQVNQSGFCGVTKHKSKQLKQHKKYDSIDCFNGQKSETFKSQS